MQTGPQKSPAAAFSLERLRLRRRRRHLQHPLPHSPNLGLPAEPRGLPAEPRRLPDRSRSIFRGLPRGSVAEVGDREQLWAGGRCLKTQL